MHFETKNAHSDHRSWDKTARGCAQDKSYCVTHTWPFVSAGKGSASWGHRHRHVLACASSTKQTMRTGTERSCQSASSCKFNEFQSSRGPRYNCSPFLTNSPKTTHTPSCLSPDQYVKGRKRSRKNRKHWKHKIMFGQLITLIFTAISFSKIIFIGNANSRYKNLLSVQDAVLLIKLLLKKYTSPLSNTW